MELNMYLLFPTNVLFCYGCESVGLKTEYSYDQIVRIKGNESEMTEFTRGVPQGSALDLCCSYHT